VIGASEISVEEGGVKAQVIEKETECDEEWNGFGEVEGT